MNIKNLYYRLNESKALIYIRNNKKKIILITLILMISIIAFLAIWFKVMLHPKNVANEVFIEVEVSSGTTADHLAVKMQEIGIIKNHNAFRLYAKIKGKDIKIKSGKYYLSPSMTAEQILDKLVRGDTIDSDIKVTIPEGSTLKNIARILNEKGVVNDIEEFANCAMVEKFKEKYFFMKDFPSNASLEGVLFPDTYFLPPGKNTEFYIDIFLKRFEDIYFNKVDPIVKENEIDFNIYQIVTMASIVEGEAKLESERPIIAGVFYNRLKKGMPLQSCATIEFILDEHKEWLSLDDLEIDSPYNTYKNEGLPPGPIGAPGLSSLLAAADPAKVDYLYFVAKGDGSHVFSRTYAEHLKAKNRVQYK